MQFKFTALRRGLQVARQRAPRPCGGMAVALVKRYCPAARVVGQEKIITEIYGITSSKPDYVVFVSCGTGLRRN
jgi:hypothetical protein